MINTKSSTGPHTKTAKDISTVFFRHILAGLIQLTFFLIAAKELGSQEFGQYAVALLLPTILAQFFNLGLPTANVYLVASKRVPPPDCLGCI